LELAVAGLLVGAEEGWRGRFRAGGMSVKTVVLLGLGGGLVGLLLENLQGERLFGDFIGEAGRWAWLLPPRMRSRRDSWASVRGRTVG